MRRFLFAALLLWPALARADGRCLQDAQNFTCGGINACPVPVLSTAAVVMEDSGGNQVCAAQVPCGNVEVDNASIRCSGDFVTLGSVPSTNVVCGANEQGWFNASSELTCGGANTLATTTAPGNPASGFLTCWPDSTGLDYTCKTSSGVTTHGVQTQPGLSGEYLTSITQQGGVNFAQVQFSQVGGSATCGQTAGTTTLYDSGSCSGQAWPTSGTAFGAGQFLRTETGGLKQLVPSTIAGDGTSISCSNAGLPPENLTCSLVSVGTAGTYLSVTTNSKGQVAAGAVAPTATEILISNGPGNAPFGDGTFTWDGANHSIVLTSLDSGLTDAYPTSVSTTGLMSRVPARTLSIPFHVTFVPNTFGSAIKWLMTTSDSATSGSQVSYTGGSVYKYWRLTVATDQFGVTTGGYQFDATMNGSSIGSVAVSAVGVHTNSGTTGSTLSTDSYGVRLNSTAGGATTNLDSAVLELSTYQFP